MGVTPGLLCQTRHLGHSHQLHWSDVSKLELWYCSNWKLFAHTKTSSRLLCSTNLRNTLRFGGCSLFLARTSGWRCHCSTLTQRLTCSCKVVLMLWKQSKMLAPWQRRGMAKGVWSCARFFWGPSGWYLWYKGRSCLKLWNHFIFSYLWLVKKWSFCQWQGVAGQERGGWCWVWMLSWLCCFDSTKSAYGFLFACLLVGNFYRKIPSGLNFVFLPVRCLMFSLLARGTLDRASLLKAWPWQVGNL